MKINITFNSFKSQLFIRKLNNCFILDFNIN